MAVTGGSPWRKVVLLVATLAVTTSSVVAVYRLSTGLLTSGEGCDAPTAPVYLYTHGGSGERVFMSWTREAGYGDFPVGDLVYELASYPNGADLRGRGNVTRSGLLSSLDTTGDLQFHDMEAEGYFSPGNDFFILVNPPPVLIQLRIFHGTDLIAFNPILLCA